MEDLAIIGSAVALAVAELFVDQRLEDGEVFAEGKDENGKDGREKDSSLD